MTIPICPRLLVDNGIQGFKQLSAKVCIIIVIFIMSSIKLLIMYPMIILRKYYLHYDVLF